MLVTLANGLKESGYTAEYRIRHQDGTYRTILDSTRIVRDAAGEPREMIGAWTDISEHTKYCSSSPSRRAAKVDRRSAWHPVVHHLPDYTPACLNTAPHFSLISFANSKGSAS